MARFTRCLGSRVTDHSVVLRDTFPYLGSHAWMTGIMEQKQGVGDGDAVAQTNRFKWTDGGKELVGSKGSGLLSCLRGE